VISEYRHGLTVDEELQTDRRVSGYDPAEAG
jgi:hypothetical protein